MTDEDIFQDRTQKTVYLEDFNRFLNGLSCSCCKSKDIAGIPNPHYKSHAMLSPLVTQGQGLAAIAGDYFHLPSVYSLLSVCNKCGNIQFFSLGQVLNFLEESASNE